MQPNQPETRDRSVKIVRLATWVLSLGAAALTAVFSVVAAHAFKGHSNGGATKATSVAQMRVPAPQHVPAIRSVPALRRPKQPPDAANSQTPTPQAAAPAPTPAPAPAPQPQPQTSGGS
jgi:hypothetical protein